jgi:translation initiation factor IF-3
VKVTIMFRGREMAHTELGRRLLDRLTEDLKELATVDTYPKLDGRNMVMVVAPVKRSVSKHEDEEGDETRSPAGEQEPARAGDAPAEGTPASG